MRTCNLSINLPLDGTYPARVLLPEKTIWCSKESPTQLNRHVTIRYDGNQFVLIPKNTAVKINGLNLDYAYALKDGDYIEFGRIKRVPAIFQADPVADFRKFSQAENMDKITIDLSDIVDRWLRIDKDTISLDGGNSQARWDEITTLQFDVNDSSQWRMKIKVARESKVVALPSKLKFMPMNEFESVILMLIFHAPFALSTTDHNLGIMTDAYHMAAYDKIWLQAELHQRVLPSTPEKIFGLWTKTKTILVLLFLFVITCILSLIESKPTGLNRESIVRFVAYFMLISGWWVLMYLGMSFLSPTSQFRLWLRRQVHKPPAG